MALLDRGLALALLLGGLSGCQVGGPERASDIQNLNAIGDDIASVSSTRSYTSRIRDPNQRSTIPRGYEIDDTK